MSTLECVRDAFEVQNHIIGTLSGGIEGPRILISIEEVDGCVKVNWRNPDICGLSDCIYHYKDTSVHTDIYEFPDDYHLKINGSNKIFNRDPWVNEEINKFYQKWGLQEG